jgi:hypothetical protein
MKEHLDQFKSSVEVQFSGNAKTYHYLCDAVQWCALNDGLGQKKDMRVVVPGKVKDGRLSLSIANVLSVSEGRGAHPGAELAVVQVIDPLGIDISRYTVVLADERAANREGVAP